MWDFFRLISHSWFKNVRRNSYNNKDWFFPFVYFFLILFVDFLPTILFIRNFNFIWREDAVLKRKLSLTNSNYPTLSHGNSPVGMTNNQNKDTDSSGYPNNNGEATGNGGGGY